MSKVLVSIISYGERELKRTVIDCIKKSSSSHELLFSIVDEQESPNDFCDFSDIKTNYIIYRPFDWSEYRGIDWARNLTTNVDFDYDYILFICGHTIFAENWDIENFIEYEKAKNKSLTGKALLTYCPAEFGITKTNNFEIKNVFRNRVGNVFHPAGTLGGDFVPGYNWPGGHGVPSDGVTEGAYLHYTWCFGPKEYVDEVPIDPSIAFHVEETFAMIRSWCAGWRFFATPKLLSWHMSHKKYPDEVHLRIDTHRPWSNQHKEKFWDAVDSSQIKLNKLMSGRLNDDLSNFTLSQVLEYCCFSGISGRYCNHNPNYHKLGVSRHGEHLRFNERLEYKRV